MARHDHLIAQLGVKVEGLAAERRGSTVLQVSRGHQAMALKLLGAHDAPEYDHAALLRHEAAMLTELDDRVHGLYIAHGDDGLLGPWLLTRWAQGYTADVLAERIGGGRRLAEQRCLELARLFARILQAFIPIHEAGYLHRDIKPEHFIFEDDANLPTVIDWAIGYRPTGPNPTYLGGNVHMLSPEAAAALLQGHSALPYTLASEIYSLGASLYVLYTGWTPMDTQGARPLKDKVRAVASQDFCGLPQARSAAEAQLQAIMSRCLNASPSSRPPSARAILNALPG